MAAHFMRGESPCAAGCPTPLISRWARVITHREAPGTTLHSLHRLLARTDKIIRCTTLITFSPQMAGCVRIRSQDPVPGRT